MLAPDEVAKMALQKENQNLKFRIFLKNHADEADLDARFLRLHSEIFEHYDCSKCRNCCTEYSAEIPIWDIEKDAAYLDLSTDVFIDTYLTKDNSGMAYITKHKPCDFLKDNGECLLGDCKPESCVNYPYTNQPERLLSLLTFMENVKICPVAYEICERLKREYNFK